MDLVYINLILICNYIASFLVPSENKKDVRSIEQTLADIQSKKKLKRSHPTNE